MKTLTLRAASLAALVALAACDDAGTDPAADDAALNDDVALLAADAVQEDLDVMNATVPLGTMSAPIASDIMDFTRSRVVTFYDADGVEQGAYDALTTASIHTLLTVSGDVTREGFEWSMDRTRDMTVTGLLGEETQRTWNGTGADEHSRARVLDADQTRTYDMSGTLLVEDVVRGVPRFENPWPLSGTITRSLTIEVVNGPNGDETITREVVVTFNGTRFVTLTVNGEEYEVDLAERGHDKVHRRHGGQG
ncbi:MAG TPA: hypothetical protein VLA43_02760 [Longimicrobiales bacterium]|nr:hypothetical protein [Longimicrobiales bacterium]